jgi:indolepyruvate ferredoxin oxidoreductase, beta subunit
MKENGTTNILFAGVGGQGIVLASSLLASVCLAAGRDVKQSEVHGMAQRGGSVTSHVRYGDSVHAPTIARGEADFLVGFELLESVRWLDHLAPAGAVFVNVQRIAPITVASGVTAYPDGLEEQIRSRCAHAVLMEALDLARKAGSTRAVNLAMLGALSTQLPFAVDAWHECVSKRVPPKTLETNWAAFLAGRDA